MKNQKGSALFFTILILSIFLSLALSLGALVAVRLNTLTGIGNSIIAFYAADAGVEKMLKQAIIDGTFNGLSESLDGANYVVQIKCNSASSDCGSVPQSSDCDANLFCIKSTGTYKGAKRAIEVKI